MFLHQSGEYWKLSVNRWVDGKPKRIHIASLGKQESSANRTLKNLLKDNIISLDEYKKFSERFDTDIWGTPKWVLDLARSVMGDIDLGANGEFGQNRTLRLKSSLRELSQLPHDR